MIKILVILILFPFVLLGQTITVSDEYYQGRAVTVKPYFVEQKIIQDTSIINTTDYKVYMLFDSRDTINDFFREPDYLFNKIRICQNQFLTIHIGPVSFNIQQSGTEINMSNDTLCEKEVKIKEFECNRVVKENKKGNIEVYYFLEKKYYKSHLGKIEVERKQMGCDDTGNNPIRLIYKNKYIYFKDIGNLIFFEFDTDNDKTNELFILNYFCCMGRLEIYKITKR